MDASLDIVRTVAVWALPVICAITLREVARGWAAHVDPPGRAACASARIEPYGRMILIQLALPIAGGSIPRRLPCWPFMLSLGGISGLLRIRSV